MNRLIPNGLGVLGAVGLSAIAGLTNIKPSYGASFTDSFSEGAQVQTRVFNKYDAQGNEILTGTFQTEMESLLLDSIEIPGIGTAIVREDPDRISSGETAVTPENGQFRIQSFFDIFTEISLDGGQTWYDSMGANRVELVENQASTTAGILSPFPFLPPDRGGYLSQFHSKFWILFPNFSLHITLSKVFHFGFVGPCGNWGCIARQQVPGTLDQREVFSSTVDGEIDVAMPMPEPSATVPLALFGLAGLWGLKKHSSSKQN